MPLCGQVANDKVFDADARRQCVLTIMNTAEDALLIMGWWGWGG